MSTDSTVPDEVWDGDRQPKAGELPDPSEGVEALWKAADADVDEKTGELNWYKKAKDYWENIPATVNGVLGGFSHISSVDIKGSQDFLKPLLSKLGKSGKISALDCGAGIGRVTSKLLLPIFDVVDLVEFCQKFLDKARAKISSPKAERFICSSLQDFTPEDQRYDVVWVQWVVGHLKDDDLVAFFKRCKQALKPNGYIVVKENITRKGEGDFWLDREDSSIVRSCDAFEAVFAQAELNVTRKQEQKTFPKELFPVMMWAMN
ncbi:hypothetical protein SARC_03383 [Sphaeroforma arctica JP610]|uniref:Alpha N-terminal protein methyltransferase 1 n=1 Tax=Sphaeroforma arctica JP610 TaxID=667725 RepID=A0A0L0G5T7_9EUKA|nr:hypothetical protein SARC_03383 [Sphaeroforma arctica JP610]KNC84390.1 hypothetical protein SARC_03383 [Sphaeroforma arctica JP610]|eukprot:XP_014158292.1 hypothetical protein SARC_03383 [Sphaeroforma arctica JP610]